MKSKYTENLSQKQEKHYIQMDLKKPLSHEIEHVGKFRILLFPNIFINVEEKVFYLGYTGKNYVPRTYCIIVQGHVNWNTFLPWNNIEVVGKRKIWKFSKSSNIFCLIFSDSVK